MPIKRHMLTRIIRLRRIFRHCQHRTNIQRSFLIKIIPISTIQVMHSFPWHILNRLTTLHTIQLFLHKIIRVCCTRVKPVTVRVGYFIGWLFYLRLCTFWEEIGLVCSRAGKWLLTRIELLVFIS